MRLFIISGLSGSGKSIALQVLEDLGAYCIDNLPVGLLPAFAAQMPTALNVNYENAAVGIDARNLVHDFAHFPDMLNNIKSQGVDCEIFFLEADDNTLLKRFSETRRKHPLTSRNIPLTEAINIERDMLKPIAANANWRIDTSRTNIHQLRDLIRERVGTRPSQSLSLLFVSFGYKHGVPADADFVFDVRCLPNPHWEPELRVRTGQDPQVASYLEMQLHVNEMFNDLKNLLETWLPRFEADNRNYMTVAIGCTGGQHRSVYLAERLGEHFSKSWTNVLTRHRELP